MAHASTNDAILAAFLEQGQLADIAKRLNMSLASLANWASEHAQLLANLHQLLTTRCKILAAHLELAALNALAAISSSTTATDDPKLRERALERQRKASSAILRHRTWLERGARASHTPTQARGTGVPPVPTSSTSLASSNAEWRMPIPTPSLDAPMPSSSRPSSPKPTIAQRLAARRLAALAAS